MSVYIFNACLQKRSYASVIQAFASTTLVATVRNIPMIAYAPILQTLLIGPASVSLYVYIYIVEAQFITSATIDINCYRAINRDRPLRRFSFIIALSSLKVAFAIYFLYLSLVSIITLRILVYSLGRIASPLIINDSKLLLYSLCIKCITVVFSASKVVPLLFS